jgi:predicted Fe-Mo cluster-binding NifX family protein
MRIAVASMGKEESSEISQQAARAPYYLIFEDGKLKESIKNPFAVGSGGAGFAVAKMLADKDVKRVVAGNFGSNMSGALRDRNLEHKEMSGKVTDALK